MVQPGDKEQPIRFVPVPEYLIAFEEGYEGTPDNVFRRVPLRGFTTVE